MYTGGVIFYLYLSREQRNFYNFLRFTKQAHFRFQDLVLILSVSYIIHNVFLFVYILVSRRACMKKCECEEVCHGRSEWIYFTLLHIPKELSRKSTCLRYWLGIEEGI